jgi:hypothetical protein
VIYIPIGQWHGLRNAEGHPPLNVPEEEMRALFRKYGMELPAD